MMKTNNLHLSALSIMMIAFFISCFTIETKAQSYAAWYNDAQKRIDTLRKGDFGLQIVDKNGQPYNGAVSVRMAKHEFPFGIAFDFYEANTMGDSYSTQDAVSAPKDAEIYKSERWGKYLAYEIPVESGKECKVNLKFAEIYFGAGNSRIFDVNIDGQLFLDNYDVFTEAGGKNIAKDTSLTFITSKNSVSIELTASLDNASIKGIEVDQVSSTCIKINCGGPGLTTTDGNHYVTESGFFAPQEQPVATKEQWMQAAMYKYFNYGVSGNSFKWSGIQPQHTDPDYTNFDNAVKWTQKVGWDLRAHTLLWGGGDDHAMPAWVRNLPTPEAITDTCKMRVTREMTRYKGIVKEYDVINEPLHAKFLQDSLVGDSINWNCFKWAHAADPDAILFINDYNVEYNWGDAVKYRDLIMKIKEMGGPVSGVGIQAHFWDCCRPGVDELVKNINIIAEAGLPIRLTEYDWGGNLTEKQQVDDFVKVATIAFSHPLVNGMICWGLSDIGAWRENSGFFDSTYRPKLAADTLLYYTKTKWATNFNSVIEGGNQLDFNAYYGNYEVEVTFNGTVKVFTVPCLKAYKDSVFTLNENDAVVKGPQFVTAKLDADNVVQITFDKPILESSIKKGDFRFFSNTKVGIDNVQYNSDKPNDLTVILTKSVTKGDYISISYFPGNLKGSDGSNARPFGPEGIYNPEPITPAVPDFLGSQANTLHVYPNPATDKIVIAYESAPFKVNFINTLGANVYSGLSDTESLEMDISKFEKGIYLLKVTDSKNAVNYKKVIVK